jgi:gamma-glutamyltranspeptidase/glutathione hydrolase
LVAGLAALCALAPPAQAKEGSRFHEAVRGPAGIVVTESPAASRVGRAVLERGGNAVDAAVATVFALSVARPQSCGLGGGGFLLHRDADGATRTLDFRETAPAAMRADQFVGPGLHTEFSGHHTVGVPATVAGMDAALRRLGTTTLAQAIAPAEQLARDGFRVPTSMVGAMRENAARLRRFPAAAAQYLNDGEPYAAGDVLRQADLAASLRRIMRGGPAAFYRGTIARRIVRDMRAPRPETQDPGLMTLRDLAAYRPIWRLALRGTFRGRSIVTMGPPTSGGIALIEMLNLLEGHDLRGAGRSSAPAIHLIAEAEKLAFADRAAYVADPAFVRVPTAELTSKAYAERRRGELDPVQARSYVAGPVATESPTGSTTHVSAIDAQGDAVAITCTIEQEFGSAIVAPGTGFLLNNEMTDFGAPGTANEPAPGKRPRSSMTPAIVVQDGRPVLVTGGAGGVRIIMGVFHAVLDTTEFGMTLAQAADAERVDNQGTRTLEVEDARIDPGVLADLQARGHTLRRLGEYGPRPRVQLAGYDLATRGTAGVSDSRSDRGALAQRRARPVAAR